jgi:DNA-binding GntR family transcriptional regulator
LTGRLPGSIKVPDRRQGPGGTRGRIGSMAGRSPSTLSASIVAALKERIIAWQYPPEHRLTEEALCREFGVSRSPVREALRVLATNGFVRRMANRGYAVKQVNLRELEELYEVRMALELYAVETLAERGAPAKALAALRDVWRDVRRNPQRKGEELAELDTGFHETLAALVGNDTLLQQLKAINERLLVFRMIDFGKADRVESTCVQHLKIIERIAAQDVAGVRKAMRRNIEDGRTIVQSTIKEALARAYALQ